MELAKKLIKKYVILLAVLGVILLISLLYVAGFRLGEGGIVRVGTLHLANVPENAEVYVDMSLAGVGPKAADLLLTPGAHQIIVSADGAHPWNELVTVVSDAVVEADPLIIPALLSGNAPEIGREGEAATALALSRLPSTYAPLTSDDLCLNISVSGSRIIGTKKDGCTPPPYLCTEDATECLPIVIFESIEPVRNVLLYPGRADTLIVTSGSLAYALEIDPREPRFFAPLAKAPNIRIAPWSESSILINSSFKTEELPLSL
jgi:hypothetical protein